MFPDLTRDDVFRIETRRLWLRWPTARDTEAILALAGDRAVAEMTARIPYPLDRATVDSFVIDVRRANAEGAALTLALAARSAPTRVIGLVEIAREPGAQAAHLGYWLGRPHWGAGLMSEGVDGLVHAFFAYAGGTSLIAEARLDNPASRRVLAKAGFVETEHRVRAVPLRGGDHTVACFRLERSDWASSDAAGRATTQAVAA